MNYIPSYGHCAYCGNKKVKLVFGKCQRCLKLVFAFSLVNENCVLLYGNREPTIFTNLYSYATKGYYDIFLIYISDLFSGKNYVPRYFIGTWLENIQKDIIPRAKELIKTKEHRLIRTAENLR